MEEVTHWDAGDPPRAPAAVPSERGRLPGTRLPLPGHGYRSECAASLSGEAATFFGNRV